MAWAILPFGFVLSVIDAWFSIQSIAGSIGAEDAPDYVVASVVGLFLTGFAVFLPVLKQAFRSVLWGLLWFLMTVGDVGTSIFGAIWYGAMHHDFREPIMFASIHYQPSNWQATAVYIVFVVTVQACCVAFGYAILALSRGAEQRTTSAYW
ncbi:hypothetical protein ACFOS3_09780 [Paractinoplanes deccanensis]|uniref:hypothetical protein n=1 Tax=Paractinoplanes deccanensis TaxID=113561 RepID=UPI0019439968|nr:hypothetical protein [Actinoplanes deccanensis]